MICAYDPCRRPVTAPEQDKVIEVHRVGDELVPFGPGMAAGTVAQAEGPLKCLYHGVCYWRMVKHQRIVARSADQTGQSGCAPEPARRT